VKKPALEGLAIEVVIGFSGSRRICVLNKEKPFANTSGIDRQMYLHERPY